MNTLKYLLKTTVLSMVLASTQSVVASDVCIASENARVDFGRIVGSTAKPGEPVIKSIYNEDIGDVKIELSADIGSTSAMIKGAFANRTDDGDTSGIVMVMSGADLTTQNNSVVITFPTPVTDVSFAYSDIDGGNGKSAEMTTFTASLNNAHVALRKEYVALVSNGPAPEVKGDTLIGNGSYTNTVRITYPEPIDRLEIKMGLTTDDKNGGTVQRLFDLTYSTICTSVCGNGVIEMDEVCDDGNVIDGDGCSSQCNMEINY